MVGAGLKQRVALIVLKQQVAQQNNEVETRLLRTLQWVNNQLESHQKLDYMFICNETWTIDNNLMTPTLKIKRNVIEKKYAELVGKGLKGDVIWQ